MDHRFFLLNLPLINVFFRVLNSDFGSLAQLNRVLEQLQKQQEQSFQDIKELYALRQCALMDPQSFLLSLLREKVRFLSDFTQINISILEALIANNIIVLEKHCSKANHNAFAVRRLEPLWHRCGSIGTSTT
jgi:hypothetical protein